VNQEFGVTAWGADWRRLAEPTTVIRPNPALPRARALTRHDQVHDLRILTGTITATVGGRADRHVSIALTTWTGAQQRCATARLADHAATDDLPDTAHTALRTDGLDPAPDPATTVAQCDCSTRTRPCVHILAVYYETARRLDERPRLALTLRHAGTTRTDEPNSRMPLTRIDPAGFYDSHGPSR
jgi:uncharacterized Zn finger protein